MKVLIACEYSGRVRDEFIKRGHDAMSCDLLPTESLGPHYQGDVMDILYDNWDIIIAHPVCQFITNSGVRWLDSDITRWKKMYDACEFFNKFIDHPCEKICIENPIPHKYSASWLKQKYTQLIQPWHFGHKKTKATCLWLKGLPKLKPTNIVGPPPKDKEERKKWAECHRMSPGSEREKIRSLTYQGIADAFATQWG